MDGGETASPEEYPRYDLVIDMNSVIKLPDI
jgi:hypothetical protein